MEKVCPRCQSNSHLVPGLVLRVSIVCGHRLCDSCVNRVFVHPTAPCPECGVTLRRTQFHLQQFEDSRVEIEVDVRKKILKDYNKTQDDFETLREYNDYLEEVETIIFNLTNGKDVEETRAKVDSYRKENQTAIIRNRMRQQRQEKVLATQLAMEQEEMAMRNEKALYMEAEDARLKKKQKESILDEIIYSDLPASEVLASHVAAAERARKQEEEEESALGASTKAVTYPSHQSQAGTTVYSTLPLKTGKIYTYTPPVIETFGPEVPALEDIESLGYLSNMGHLEELQQGGQESDSPRPLDPQRSVQTCSICLEAPQYSVETNCGHLFCAQCILMHWTHERRLERPQACHCPLCRTAVTQLTSAEDLATQNRELYSQVDAYNQQMYHTSSRWPHFLVLALVSVAHLLLTSPIPSPEMIYVLIKYVALMLILFVVIIKCRARLNRR